MARRERFEGRRWLLLGALLLASCASKHTDYGSETHWLSECSADRDCGDGDLHCICGSCTRACKNDASCGAGAACYDLTAPFGKQCGTHAGISASTPAQCLLRCSEDGDCGSRRGCVQGACVPARSGDAGEGPSSFGELGPLADSVSLTEPVTVPEPSFVIAGADENLIGTWQQTDCEPQTIIGCMTVTIARDPSGAIVGSVTLDPDPSSSGPQGPFAAVRDPDRFYPTEVDPAQLVYLSLTSGVPYRMFDGAVADGRLKFTLSGYDLWHDWCALQTSFAWQLPDRVVYACAPDDEAALAQLDDGKRMLCGVSTLLDALDCARAGAPRDCMCTSSERICTQSVCRCDARGCSADFHMEQAYGDFELDVASQRMAGAVLFWLSGEGDNRPRSFERVAP